VSQQIDQDQEQEEGLRSLEENCDGEFSSFYGRSQAGTGEFFGDVLERRASRREAVKAGLVLTAGAAAGVAAAGAAAQPVAEAAPDAAALEAVSGQFSVTARPSPTGLTFQGIHLDRTDEITLAPGYVYDRVISWGDPLKPGVPAFNLDKQSPALQELQFGYNADFLAFMPLPLGSTNPNEGLLWTNSEYTNEELMFREWVPASGGTPPQTTKDMADIGIAAHGGNVVHVRRDRSGRWEYVLDSPYNRRVTGTTPMKFTGPAAGDPYMRTSADPNGTAVMGMFNNCGGGVTPWGTVLSAEENFNQYFGNRNGMGGTHPNQASHTRYGLAAGATERGWEQFHDRFDCAKEPNEANRFGWVVEIDPYDPAGTPRKHTALGRMKHEAAAGTVSPGGKWVSYTGDDERFEYLYKFVSAKSYIPGNRAHNMTLLESGTLYVAKLNDDGTGEWIPLVYGQRGLTPANGFFSQANVLINARFAGDVVGATKMDRPEDVEVNPVNRKVYMACTNNSQRGTPGRAPVDRANPRPENNNGHIIEITENNNDHAATRFRWEMFIVAGHPMDPTTYFAGFPKEHVAGVSSPDNIAFDRRGNLWIATDGQISSTAFLGPNTPAGPATDSIYAVAVTGPERGLTKRLVNGVLGAEIAALEFNPDSTTLFLSIQHPGEGGTIARPVSTWPDGPNRVPRPSVIAVRRADGRPVGS
jgi:uncharacterized protein